MDFSVSWTGVWIKLSHKEACTLTEDIPRQATKILKYLDLPGYVEEAIEWALPLASFAKKLITDILTIKYKNETSGSKGVKIFFNVWKVKITCIYRRGKKKNSPCS